MSEFIKSDMNKMMLFMFLGLIVAILVLGFHKSPAASRRTGITERNRTPSPTRTPQRPPIENTQYPSDRRDY